MSLPMIKGDLWQLHAAVARVSLLDTCRVKQQISTFCREAGDRHAHQN